MKKLIPLKLILLLVFLSTLISCPNPAEPGSEYPVNYLKLKKNNASEQTISKSNYINFSTINSSLETPVIAVSSSGVSVIAWVDNNKGSKDIYAQRFDSSGKPLGEIFEVNTTTSNDQYLPAVAINESGSFLIAWTSKGQDGDGLGIYARRYDKNGRYMGPEFKVNTSTAKDQWIPAVAVSNTGSFVIVWQSFQQDGSGYAVIAQKFDNNGNPYGPEMIVNDTGRGSQEFPRIAMDSNGAFIVTWNSSQNQGLGDINSVKNTDIYAKKYNRAGNPEGAEFIVSTTVGEQWLSSVALNDSNSYVITWNAKEPNTDENFDIYARYYQNGVPAKAAFKVNSFNRPDQLSHPVTAIDGTGNFIIVWNSATGVILSSALYGKKYSSSGNEQEPEFKINANGLNILQPDVAMDRSGNYSVTWREY